MNIDALIDQLAIEIGYLRWSQSTEYSGLDVRDAEIMKVRDRLHEAISRESSGEPS